MSGVLRRFEVSGQLEDLPARLRAMEWKVQSLEDDRVEARQGSQVATRLLGGWHVDPKKLPKRLVAERAGRGIALAVEESMGLGVFDPKLRRRYERVFADLERRLGG